MRKKPILFNNKKGLLEKEQTVVIGVIGTHRGTGVTHSCIMLANYLCESKRNKVALVECNNHKDFSYIQMAYEGLSHKVIGRQKFEIYDVNYYKEATQQEITEVLNGNYDYVILDFGSDIDKNCNEFLRCNIKLVVSSLADWKRQELFKFIRTTSVISGNSTWEYLILFGNEKEVQEVKKVYKIKVHRIPFEPDPFLLSKESLKLFQKF